MVGATAKGSSMGLHGNGDGNGGSWVLEAAGKASKAVRQASEADGGGAQRLLGEMFCGAKNKSG